MGPFLHVAFLDALRLIYSDGFSLAYVTWPPYSFALRPEPPPFEPPSPPRATAMPSSPVVTWQTWTAIPQPWLRPKSLSLLAQNAGFVLESAV